MGGGVGYDYAGFVTVPESQDFRLGDLITFVEEAPRNEVWFKVFARVVGERSGGKISIRRYFTEEGNIRVSVESLLKKGVRKATEEELIGWANRLSYDHQALRLDLQELLGRDS